MESEESRLPSASTDAESKEDRKGIAAKHPSIWNPFRRLETEADALEAIKAGAVAAGIIAIEHVVFALGAGTRSAIVGNLITIVLMAFLGWSIFKAQKIWASVGLLAWAILEILAKIVFMLGADASRGSAGSVIIINIIAAAGALLSVRGCRKLQKLERTEKSEEIEERQ
jgi:hypothetical protein